MSARIVGTGLGKGWDERSRQLALAMYLEDGASHGRIADELKRRGYKMTRNAVLGFIHREKEKASPEEKRKFIRIQEKPVKAPHVPHAPKLERPSKLPAIKKPEQVIQLVKPCKPIPTIKKEKQIEYIGPIGIAPAWGFCQYTRDDVAKAGWQMCGHPSVVKGEGRKAVTLPWCESHRVICRAQPQTQKRETDAA